MNLKEQLENASRRNSGNPSEIKVNIIITNNFMHAWSLL